jgi:predicted phage terminase large subunit-like protein
MADLFSVVDDVQDVCEKIPQVDAERELCRRSLREFVRLAWHVVEPGTKFVPGFHIDTICDHLEAVYRGEIRRLIINIPPRFSKSTIVSLLWPVWCWLQQPSLKFLFASYAEDLALRDATRARRLIYSGWFQERWGDEFLFVEDMNTKGRYATTKGGVRFSTGMDAQLTGEGGDIIALDDPHNVSEALSKVERETVKILWTEAFSSRFNNANTGRAVIVQQRVHEDDLTAFLMQRGGWELLCLPNEWSELTHCKTSLFEDPRKPGVDSPLLARYPWIEQGEGALLCPDRMNREQAEQQRREMGSVGYNGQYNQRPINRGGEFFKTGKMGTWEFRGDYIAYRLPGAPIESERIFHRSLCTFFVTADTASTANTHADATAICAWCVTPQSDLLWMDMFHGRVEIPQVKTEIKAMCQRWSTQLVVIEYAASGIGLVQDLRTDPTLLVRGIHPVTDAELKAGVKVKISDKVSRATMGQIRMEGGQVFIPAGMPAWLDKAIAELGSFTPEMTHAHDDIVDAFCYAVMHILTGYIQTTTIPLASNFRVEGMGQGFAVR